MGRSFLGSRRQVITRIILPAASPIIFAGLRLGCAAAFVGAILAELLITPVGIGDLITYNRSVADYPSMYAAILSIIVVSVLFIEVAGTDRGGGVPAREASARMTIHANPPAAPATATDAVVEVRDRLQALCRRRSGARYRSASIFRAASSPRCSALRAAARPPCSRSSPACFRRRRARCWSNGTPVQRPGSGAGLRVPGFRADALGDRARQRRLRTGTARHRQGRARGHRAALHRRGRPVRLRETSIRTSFPAACASGSASPGRWRSRPMCC